MLTHSIGRSSLHRLAPLAAILLAACATSHFDVDDNLELLRDPKRVQAVAREEETLRFP